MPEPETRIVVAGASRFIESALSRRLAGESDDSVAVLRDAWTIVEAQDVALRGADVLAHLTGIAHRRAASDEVVYRSHVASTEIPARACIGAGARFDPVSSAKEYGDASDGRRIDFSSALAPLDASATTMTCTGVVRSGD